MFNLMEVFGPSWFLEPQLSFLFLSSFRYTNALSPARHQAERLCWLQPKDQGPVSAKGVGQILAWRLPEVCLLRLPFGRSGFYPVHEGQPYPLSQRLSEVGIRLAHQWSLDSFWDTSVSVLVCFVSFLPASIPERGPPGSLQRTVSVAQTRAWVTVRKTQYLRVFPLPDAPTWA